MRVTTEWLGDWVSIECDAEELAQKLTMAGLEVDSVETVVRPSTGVVVGEVLSVAPHPNADRLSLCVVGDGESEHEVVCGAPNVAAGIKAPFARVGALLQGGMRIEAATLRGSTSHGMLCSGDELGIPIESGGLLILDEDAPVGRPIERYLHLADHVLDIAVTANRGDCFSVIGVARELSAILPSELRGPDFEPVQAQSTETFEVALRADAACARFAGRVIRGIRADARSPLWLRERLRRCGIRPIDPVVDVTNYVMLELGQPLHAYDLERLRAGIEVRWGKSGERLELLDGRVVDVDDDVLVIADGSGAIGLAGIMGGAGTAVSADTRNVFLESAFFAPDALAGRARRYGLHTEASLRFERGVDPAGQERAVERATQLLQEIVGGDCGPTVVEEWPRHVPQAQSVRLDHAHLESVLGMKLERARIERALASLAMHIERADEGWLVTAPSHRFDISIAEDLIEEVGRMIGYDAIAPRPALVVERLGAITESRIGEDEAADLLAHRGYTEVVNYSFVDRDLDEKLGGTGGGQVELRNPISSDMSIMRRSLWPGLVTTARHNLSRQISGLRIFETGTVFNDGGQADGHTQTRVLAGLAVGARWPEHWEGKPQALDFYDIKRDVELLLDLTRAPDEFEFQSMSHPALSPAQSAAVLRGGKPAGWVGSLHPRLLQALELRHETFVFELDCGEAFGARVPAYRAVSRYPSVRRDLAIIVDDNVTARALENCVRECAGSLLNEVVIFDVYRGQGIPASRKSVAIGLILQDASRTLTDGDADDVMLSVAQHLGRSLGATIRT